MSRHRDGQRLVLSLLLALRASGVREVEINTGRLLRALAAFFEAEHAEVEASLGWVPRPDPLYGTFSELDEALYEALSAGVVVYLGLGCELARFEVSAQTARALLADKPLPESIWRAFVAHYHAAGPQRAVTP